MARPSFIALAIFVLYVELVLNGTDIGEHAGLVRLRSWREAIPTQTYNLLWCPIVKQPSGQYGTKSVENINWVRSHHRKCMDCSESDVTNSNPGISPCPRSHSKTLSEEVIANSPLTARSKHDQLLCPGAYHIRFLWQFLMIAGRIRWNHALTSK
jgi:hypothetical protein